MHSRCTGLSSYPAEQNRLDVLRKCLILLKDQNKPVSLLLGSNCSMTGAKQGKVGKQKVSAERGRLPGKCADACGVKAVLTTAVTGAYT